MPHTLLLLVENQPGVLDRVASLFRRRGVNIDALTVVRTSSPGVSRMTIVADCDETSVHRVAAYLARLVNVLEVRELPAAEAARDERNNDGDCVLRP